MHLFNSIRPGDRVTYRTAQGQVASGRAVIINRPAGVVVCNAGGRYGRPVCVTAATLISVSPARRPHPAEWALIIGRK